MAMLDFIKSNLRETIVLSIEETISSLKQHLPTGSSKYTSLILIESNFVELSKKIIHGTMSEAESQRAKSRIRESLLYLIEDLKQEDFEEAKVPAEKKILPKIQDEQKPSMANWSAAVVERNGLKRVVWKVNLSYGSYRVSLNESGLSSYNVLVDDIIKGKYKYSLFKQALSEISISDLFIDFNMSDGSDSYQAQLIWGTGGFPLKFKKLRLIVNNKILYSEGNF